MKGKGSKQDWGEGESKLCSRPVQAHQHHGQPRSARAGQSSPLAVAAASGPPPCCGSFLDVGSPGRVCPGPSRFSGAEENPEVADS